MDIVDNEVKEVLEEYKPKFCALCTGSDLIMIACDITYAVTYEETSIEYFCNQCKCTVKVHYKKDKDVEFVPVDGKSVPYKEAKFKNVSI